MSRVAVIAVIFGAYVTGMFALSDVLFGAPHLTLSLRYTDLFIGAFGGYVVAAWSFRKVKP